MASNSSIDVGRALMALLTSADTQAMLKAANPGLAERAVADGAVQWEHIDVGIEHKGTKITLPARPEPMQIPEAIAALLRKQRDEETTVNVSEVIDAFPLDGVVAFYKALSRKYGWANSVPTPGFWGPKPPEMITVDIGPGIDDKIQVPWGGFQVPGVENQINTSVTSTKRGAALVLSGKVRKKEVATLKELAALTREIVKNESIYRGKAIRLRSASSSTIDMDNPPEFMNLSAASAGELVLPRPIEALIKVNIWTLIEQTERCRRAGIPLKRGVLLSGKYGVGKTLASLITAQKCVDNGWTFITLDKAQALHQTLEFARRYQPCVIFVEDIDRAAADRNESTNDLLNVMDGVLSKDSQIMVVMTTNHVEKINPAMLRPGRLDAVINVTAPDAEAVERLLRIYGRGLIPQDESLERVGKQLAGNIPAMIREVTERAKLASISSGHEYVSEDDLIVSADGMQHHMDLVAGPKAALMSPEEVLGHALANVVAQRVGAQVAKSTSMVMEVLNNAGGQVSFDPDSVVDSDEGGDTYKEQIAKLIAPNGAAPQIEQHDQHAH